MSVTLRRSGGAVDVRKVYESGGPGGKTVVLWASRHPPLPAQIRGLEEKLGPIVVYQMSGMIPNAEYIAEKARELKAEYIVPVLPLSMIARLTELSRREGFTVVWAEMQQVKMLNSEPKPGEDYDPETETYIKGAEGTYKVMRFKQFHKIKSVTLELEPL